MPPQGTDILDNFNRANETRIGDGANWDPGPFGGSNEQFTLTSNAVTNSLAGYVENYWVGSSPAGPTFGADCYVGFTIATMPTTAYSMRGWLGIVGGVGTTSADGYSFALQDTSGGIAVISVVTNGSSTALGANITAVPQAGDTYILERIGSNFELWRFRSSTWTSLGTRSDSTHSGAGHVGLSMFSNSTAGILDDFIGGTISGGSNVDITGVVGAATASGPVPDVTTEVRPYVWVTVA